MEVPDGIAVRIGIKLNVMRGTYSFSNVGYQLLWGHGLVCHLDRFLGDVLYYDEICCDGGSDICTLHKLKGQSFDDSVSPRASMLLQKRGSGCFCVER